MAPNAVLTLRGSAANEAGAGQLRGALAADAGGLIALRGSLAFTAEGNGATLLGGAGTLQVGGLLRLTGQVRLRCLVCWLHVFFVFVSLIFFFKKISIYLYNKS